MSVLGIDLGTTYSVVATVGTDGRTAVLRHPSGAETMPSVVCFESPGSLLVGEAARAAAVALPDRTVALVKRRMGTDSLFYFDGQEYSPEAISALILRGLVESVLGPAPGPVRAVVTVPAYFGLREREATQQACELAGIEVLELVAEPVAAAIHYGSRRSGDRTVLVYDLGGGTCDVTVLRLGAASRVVATGGDTELGGADWDRRLVGQLLDRFRASAALTTEPEDDEAFMAELLLTAERTKRRLSVADRQRVSLRFGGATVTVEVSAAEFAELTADLLDRTFERVAAVLRDAGAEVDEILLVGGSSRMPAVAAGLHRRFGRPARLVDPDFAVAKGAALRAARLVAGASGLAGRAVDETPAVVPRAVGLLLHDSHDPAGERLVVWHVVHRNEELPVVREAVVATIVEAQRTVRIQVYEQAGDVESAAVADNRSILDGEISGLSGVPAGSPVRVVLTLGLDGRLAVSATELSTGRGLQLEAYMEGVLDAVSQRRQVAAVKALKVRR